MKSMMPGMPCGFLRFVPNVIAILLASVTVVSQGAEQMPGESAIAYVGAMSDLEDGDFALAVTDLTRALSRDTDNADYLRARGVANTLAEKFPAAIADLERALRLNAEDTEAKLWLAAAYRMSGDPATGSKYFSMRDLPPNYANMVYNEMAMDYWSSRTNGTYWDRGTKRQITVGAPVKKQFPDAARIYAGRHRATGIAAMQLSYSKIKEAMDRADWPAVLKEWAALARTAPDDATLRGYHAQALLGLGDALHAREEFTHALCIQPLWVEGYMGRAQAAAMIGDFRRASADLETVATLGTKPRVAGEKVKQLDAARKPGDAPAQFARAVEADAPFENLVAAALDAHRWFNDRRHRYDEDYQDRIWILSNAIRTDPKNPAWPEMLGRFLHDNHVVGTLWNGPRERTQLRPQSAEEKQAELQRALDAEDAALKIDPKCANALATKGWVLVTTGNPPAAERCADQALAIEGQNAPALKLKWKMLVYRAGQLQASAHALRQPRVEHTREERADGTYEVTRTYPPTAEALAEADRRDAEAAVIMKEVARLQGVEQQVEDNVVRGILYDAHVAMAGGKLDRARIFLDHAWALNPGDVMPGMIELAKRSGDAARERLYTLLTSPLQHTTASDELKTAWDDITRTALKDAGDALDRAAKIDPVDARVSAYRSVIAAARGDKNAAARQRHAALALEEARARLMGSSYLHDGGAPVVFAEPGLSLLLRLQEADALAVEGHPDRALEMYRLNLALEPRMGREALTGMMPGAMLPDPAQEAATVPMPPTFASLMATSRLGAGRALLAFGKPADAQKEYLAVRAYLANWPATAPGGETLHTADGWARLGLAEAAFAARDFNAAHVLLDTGEGWPWGLPKELDQRRKELSEKVRASLTNAAVDEQRELRRQSPQQMQQRRMQDDIAQLEKQRDQILAEINRPDTAGRDRAFLKQSAGQLQQLIDQRKAALSHTGQGQ